VHGDVTFGAGVRCVGDVVIQTDEPRTLADDTVLHDSLEESPAEVGR
jgi:UTP--glucose-1-phosphate uridylyltransferase